MSTKSTSALRTIALLFAFGCSIAATSGPPDSEYNPAAMVIESVDAAYGTSSLDIRHTADPGPGSASRSVLLTTHPLDDVDPRLALDSNGGAWVVWWRDGSLDEVLIKRRLPRGTSWSAEIRVSEDTEQSRDPAIAHDGARAWVVYVIKNSESYAVAVRSGDGSVPWPTRTILHTSYTGTDLDPQVHNTKGNLWVTWAESPTLLGWREYDYASQTWLATGFEPMADGDRFAAFSRVAQLVVGQ